MKYDPNLSFQQLNMSFIDELRPFSFPFDKINQERSEYSITQILCKMVEKVNHTEDKEQKFQQTDFIFGMIYHNIWYLVTNPVIQEITINKLEEFLSSHSNVRTMAFLFFVGNGRKAIEFAYENSSSLGKSIVLFATNCENLLSIWGIDILVIGPITSSNSQ